LFFSIFGIVQVEITIFKLNHMKKLCGIYTRVSTNNQAEKEFSSCEAQEEKIKSYIASQEGWTVYKVYSDAGFTGANTDRPALQQMLQDLKDGKINMIVIYKIDRLTRSPKDFYQLMEYLEETNTDFISITERFDTSTPTGRLLRNIMLTFAQFERELSSERTRDKMLERARKGMCNGGNTPHGYDRKKKKLIIEKKEEKEVELIFETYVETQSLNRTYDTLKEKGIMNREGKVFTKAHLFYMLRNVLYIGKIKHKGEVYEGLHKAIISEDMFTLAQSVHKEKTKKFRVYKNYLFGGLITCEECGSHMTGCFTNKWKNEELKRYFYYRCTCTYKRDWTSCSVRQVSADRLEQYILENLERISVDKEYLNNYVFRLNIGGQPGYEPKDSSSQLSPEMVTQTIQSFISKVKTKTGVSSNLLAKRTIREILYSPETIKISLFLQPNSIESGSSPNSFDQTKNPANELQGFGVQPVTSPVREFVTAGIARGPGFEPRYAASKATVLPLDDPRIYPLMQNMNSSIIQKTPGVNPGFCEYYFLKTKARALDSSV
jgi:site-specific DNA recombinase